MSSNLYLATPSDENYGVVTAKIQSLSLTPLNLAAITMTKVEGGYIASRPVLPTGNYSVHYENDNGDIDLYEIIEIGASELATVDLTPVTTAIAAVQTTVDDIEAGLIIPAPVDLAPVQTAIGNVQTAVNALSNTNLAPVQSAIATVQTTVSALTNTNLTPVLSAITDVQTSVDSLETGGGSAVDLAPLTAAVAQVLDQATQARKGICNNVSVNLVTGVITILEDNGTTPFIRFQGTNDSGQATATNATRRTRIS